MTDPAPRVLRTLYPVSAELVTGDEGPQAWAFAKAVVTADRVYLFVPGPAGDGIVTALDLPYVALDLAKPWLGSRAVSTVTLERATLRLVNLGGCGCTSSLKRYRPFDTRPIRTI